MENLSTNLIFLTLIAVVSCQQFSFSTQFNSDGSGGGQSQSPPEDFRRRGGGGGGGFGNFGGFSSSSSSASASAGGGFPTSSGQAGGPLSPELQSQFREIFDWNKNLTADPRFQSCRVPDIGDVSRACPKRAFYHSLNPQHRNAVGMVKTILTGPNNPQQTVCLAGAMRDLGGMNPNVWVRGMLGAHLSDVGLFDLEVPPLVEVMPHIFINNEFLQQAKQQSVLGADSRRCIQVDGTMGRDNGVENNLWYFREDIQVNSFHLNWHLIYPFTGIQRKADRQGELFYFSHHSHLARYHAERLSNGLGRIAPLNVEFNTPVPEAYHPHLNDTNSGNMWTPRRPNRPIRDTVFINIMGVPPNVSVADRVLHVRRVEDSILRGSLLLRNGQRSPLNSRTGIDVLGDVVEASIFSMNPEYYGMFGFHNEGHVLLGLIEDPENSTNLPPGVMQEVATAMRDPVFYTYHTAMDETFDLHKQRLPPYQPNSGELPLAWDGVEVESVEVKTDGNSRSDSDKLTTFFTQRTFDLSRGLDFNRSGVEGSLPACVTHLDHNPFTYTIHVNRHPQVVSASGRGTVRIFMAPRSDENGRRYSMIEQRKLFFMMDMFSVELRPGRNRITRGSVESSLTIDIPQSLTEISQTKPDKRRNRPRTYCACGWPAHLLLPRGTERGMDFDLFVIITNGEEDYVAPTSQSRRRPEECKPAPIYCGRLNDTYPDSRPMGYPFDRLPYTATNNWWERPRYVENIVEYVEPIPNAAVIRVKIQHLGRINPQQRPSNIQFEDGSNGNFNNPQRQILQTAPLRNNDPQVFQPANQDGGFNPQLQTVPLVHQEHDVLRNQRRSDDQNFDYHDQSGTWDGSEDVGGGSHNTHAHFLNFNNFRAPSPSYVSIPQTHNQYYPSTNPNPSVTGSYFHRQFLTPTSYSHYVKK